MIPLKDDIPSSTFPYVTVSIIVATVAVYVYQLTLGYEASEIFIYKTAAVPYDIAHLMGFKDGIYWEPKAAPAVPLPLTIFTSMFVHGGIFHLAGNMLFMWIFADNVEDTLGHLGFLAFYLASGFLAAMAHIIMQPRSTVPMIGASGAIAGVLGAYFLLFPRAKVSTLVFLFLFVTVIKVPAVFFLGFWFLMQVFSSGFSDGVAWYAHIGGFLAGVVLTALMRPSRVARIFRR